MPLSEQSHYEVYGYETVQATAAAPFVSSGLGDSLLPGYTVAQSLAAVPDLTLVRS